MSITHRPFHPRLLTKSELDRNDVFMTTHPRSGDLVTLVDPIRLAQWLLLIFNRQYRDCVERPRQLSLHHDKTVELDFWTLHNDGSEMFWVLVPEKDCQRGPSGRAHRDATLWSQAASGAGIPITFIYESEILHQGPKIANYFRLLPHAQAARHLPDITLLRGRISEVFSHLPIALTFEQVENSLQKLDKAAVRATLSGLICEGQLTFEEDLPLSDRTLLTWGAQA